jgi:hypothetical protein
MVICSVCRGFTDNMVICSQSVEGLQNKSDTLYNYVKKMTGWFSQSLFYKLWANHHVICKPSTDWTNHHVICKPSTDSEEITMSSVYPLQTLNKSTCYLWHGDFFTVYRGFTDVMVICSQSVEGLQMTWWFVQSVEGLQMTWWFVHSL